MALTEIEYGSLASSEVMNNNFEYLDNRISELSQSQISGLASINSNIVSINTALSGLGDSVDESVEEINTTLGEIGSMVEESGLYVTTYINGASWCREYFSDKDKTRLYMDIARETADTEQQKEMYAEALKFADQMSGDAERREETLKRLKNMVR